MHRRHRGPGRRRLRATGPCPGRSQDGRARAILLRRPQDPGARHGEGALRAAVPPLPGGAAADRLRRPRQDQVQDGPGSLGERPERLPGNVLPPRAVLPGSRSHARGRAGPGAGNHLRRRLFRHAGGFAGPQAPGQFGLCGLPVPGEPQRQARLADQRLGRLPGRLLFPRHRRALPVRPVGPGAGGRRRRPRPDRGIPELHPRLFRNAPGGLGHGDGLCAPRRAERDRRLPFRHAPGGGGHHGHRDGDLPARRCRPPGLCAPHLHVLVLGEGQADRGRLASGDPRFGRAWRSGPAPASASGGR